MPEAEQICRDRRPYSRSPSLFVRRGSVTPAQIVLLGNKPASRGLSRIAIRSFIDSLDIDGIYDSIRAMPGRAAVTARSETLKGRVVNS